MKRMMSRERLNKNVPRTWRKVPDFILSKIAFYCNVIVSSPYFNNSITVVILIASLQVGVQTYQSMEDNQVLNIIDDIILYIFTAECIIKLVACGNRPWEYVWYKGNFVFWNIFDFLVVVVCYLPLGAGMVTVIRLFRLLRVLKLVKALPELQVLVMGLLGSLSSIFYVALLLMLVFYLYGIMCVSFFRDNDPVHFGQLETAFLTLFRMSTFEDWTDVLYTQLYGCDVYPYHFRTELCTDPNRAMGWVAAPFFVSFIILSSLVVLNLFIGVIISNMNEARATLDQEAANEVHPEAEDEFQQDSAIMRAMIANMENLSSQVATVRDAMQEMQKEVTKLENSARVRKNKFRNGESSKTGFQRLMAEYSHTANRIKRGLGKVEPIESQSSTAQQQRDTILSEIVPDEEESIRR